MKSHMKLQLGSSLFRDLQYAAIHPNKRNYFIFRAFNKYLAMTESSGVALIRFSAGYESAYKLAYCGPEQAEMEKWLQERIVKTADATIGNINGAPSVFSNARMQFLPFNNGLLIIWHRKQLDIFDEHHKVLLDYLEAISYVEKNEQLHFYDQEKPFEPELSKLIQQKEQDGITELLALTKTIGDCDFVFWGDTNSNYIEVEAHLGSQADGFGFQLPVGQGLGGNAAQNKSLLQANDYKNCAYRYQEVSRTVDKEDVRTVLALPIKDDEANASGILYASNRKVKPFSLKTKFLLLRLGQSIEPLTKRKELKRFFTENRYWKYIKQKKAELRNIIQQEKQIAKLEAWLEDFLKGSVMVVDEKRHQYANRTTKKSPKNRQPLVFPLKNSHLDYGELFIWTDMKLPPEGWSDFIDDIINGIYIIMERNKRINHAIELERSQWITSLIDQEQASDVTTQYKKGIQLGVPLDCGEVWTIYWDTNDKQISSSERMKIEEVVLKSAKCPLIFSGKMGFILFDKPRPCQPEKLRDQLLEVFPVTTWIVHSAAYSSFQTLQHILKQIQRLLKSVTMYEQKKYVLEFNDFGLDYLLTNPKLSDDLSKFAYKVLQPIIRHDKENESQLTKTLALYLVYQSPTQVAKKLYIHINTVHYRVNRAKELLELDLDKLGTDIALRLAAYTWLYNQRFTL